MKRRSAGVAALVVATAGALAGAATAFGSGEKTPITASDYYYASGMSPQEVSLASQGKPGELVPPCPDERTVTDLKAQGLPVGPCDPLPEAGAALVLPPDVDEPAEDDASQATCAGMFVRSGDAGGVSQVEGPCGPGARIIDVQPYRDKAGTACAKVSYVVAAGKTEKTSSSCVGDPADSSGPHVLAEGK
jgi:hypothetical protein